MSSCSWTVLYIKSLDINESLTLHKLTLKIVILLALTILSRSVDYSRLDIRICFINHGVTFKPIYLAILPSLSEDLFSPEFTQDVCLCPVAILNSYEWSLDSVIQKSNFSQTCLILSLIGKHIPVTNSTMARWLLICLLEAGINISVFKAHLVRETAAWVGVTEADILKAANWSLEETFQTFQSSFWSISTT